MSYNLVIIFVIEKYFLRRFRERKQEVSNHVKFLCLLLFSYGVIFVVFLLSFVGMCNFICKSVN